MIYVKTFKFLSDNDLGKTIISTKILARRFLKNYQELDFNVIHKDKYIFFGGLKVALYEKIVAVEKTAPMKPTQT